MGTHRRIVVPPSDAPGDPRKITVPGTRPHVHSDVRPSRLRSHVRDVLERMRSAVRGAVDKAADELKAERDAPTPALIDEATPFTGAHWDYLVGLSAQGHAPEIPTEPTDAIDVMRFDTPVVDILATGDEPEPEPVEPLEVEDLAGETAAPVAHKPAKTQKPHKKPGAKKK